MSKQTIPKKVSVTTIALLLIIFILIGVIIVMAVNNIVKHGSNASGVSKDTILFKSITGTNTEVLDESGYFNSLYSGSGKTLKINNINKEVVFTITKENERQEAFCGNGEETYYDYYANIKIGDTSIKHSLGKSKVDINFFEIFVISDSYIGIGTTVLDSCTGSRQDLVIYDLKGNMIGIEMLSMGCSSMKDINIINYDGKKITYWIHEAGTGDIKNVLNRYSVEVNNNNVIKILIEANKPFNGEGCSFGIDVIVPNIDDSRYRSITSSYTEVASKDGYYNSLAVYEDKSIKINGEVKEVSFTISKENERKETLCSNSERTYYDYYANIKIGDLSITHLLGKESEEVNFFEMFVISDKYIGIASRIYDSCIGATQNLTIYDLKGKIIDTVMISKGCSSVKNVDMMSYDGTKLNYWIHEAGTGDIKNVLNRYEIVVIDNKITKTLIDTTTNFTYSGCSF